MKHILSASALALVLCLPQSAKAGGFCWDFGVRFKGCVNLCFSIEPCCSPSYGPCIGPWYTHFPPHGHYYPGPTMMYPHWPQQPMAAAPMAMPAANAAMYNPYSSGYHNVSYYGGVPSYWYGR